MTIPAHATNEARALCRSPPAPDYVPGCDRRNAWARSESRHPERSRCPRFACREMCVSVRLVGARRVRFQWWVLQQQPSERHAELELQA